MEISRSVDLRAFSMIPWRYRIFPQTCRQSYIPRQILCWQNLVFRLHAGCVSTLLSSIWNSDVLGFAILALESEAWLQERRTNSSAGGVGYGGDL
ncbi:hypothetical protein TNCV_3339871 [Trichonephila clavipes]|nr:hypothetical protein TNCV_3339871 [Trichonephila clavipes]